MVTQPPGSAAVRHMVQLTKLIKIIVVNITLTIILLTLLEGFSSIVLRARDTFSSNLSRDGFWMIDLVDEIRKLPPQEIEGLYNRGAGLHYSEKGNHYVADLLFRKLLEIPEIQSKFRRIQVENVDSRQY